MSYAIKCTPNRYRPEQWFLLRDLDDFVVHVWTRRSEAEKALASLGDSSCEITENIPAPALARALEKKERLAAAGP